MSQETQKEQEEPMDSQKLKSALKKQTKKEVKSGEIKKEKKTSRSAKAHLFFPVGRCHRLLRNGRYAERIGAGAPIFLAAILEYLTAEILELSGNASLDNSRKRITPRHLQLAIRGDEELSSVLSKVLILNGGVIPHIEEKLLPQRASSKKSQDEK